jgi:glycosyltransferase involved in cell wall biosynthesis
MKIVFLTAGAAGMYCGSCMHDNALARALRHGGNDCILQPLYTPIRTDELSVAQDRVFFGGVNIYLTEKLPLFRFVPRAVKRLLDRPGFLKWATRRASSTDASGLGDLTLSMLSGEDGNQKEEVERLVRWLRDDIQPDAILLTNLLIAGSVPTIRRELPNTRLIAILQGDDAFLDYLPKRYRDAAIERMGELGRMCDWIVVNSRFYGQRMTQMLGLDPAKVVVEPLTIDGAPFAEMKSASNRNGAAANRPQRIGYLARIAPEKGLHHLIDAYIDLAKRPGCESIGLDIAGWLGEQNRGYFSEQMARLSSAGLADRVRHLGSPDLDGKIAMLRGIDVMSVPTEHEEPKGLSVLEAMATGVPVVLPAKGAFPEIVEQSGGGLLVPPNDPKALADALLQVLQNDSLRDELSKAGRQWVLGQRTIQTQAISIVQLIANQVQSAQEPVLQTR